MKPLKLKFFWFIFCLIFIFFIQVKIFAQTSDEIYRPQIHFTPQAHWMNDPNGMIYYKGTYHLFFQYFPGASVWGPMHWGHATSHDLINWQQQPIALYPDSLGYIFSGSVVADINNTSGLGTKTNPPLIAIFTQHDTVGEKAGVNNFQNQSIAYSLNDGKTWSKYLLNPVLKNPGIRDFRDPKVSWFEPQKKWVMTLATKDRITFYSSKNLKQWKKESEFGFNIGAHGGVWECPDLFTLNYNDKKIWVLSVSLNPGGPNKGSATQYFLGNFNGKTFTTKSTKTKWIDYGPDDYAGVTWSKQGERKIFLGWMSNWMYATTVPTETWRSAMTIPRELKLKKSGNEYFIASEPVSELSSFQSKKNILKDLKIGKAYDLSDKIKNIQFPCRINLNIEDIQDFSMEVANEVGDKILLGFNKIKNQYFIDRSHSGKINFENEFAAKHVAPRISTNKKMNISLIIDVSSIELFADDGLTVMTEIFFPNKPYNKIIIKCPREINVDKLEYYYLKSNKK